MQAAHEDRAGALDGVAAGLVGRLASVPVALGLAGRQGAEFHLGGHHATQAALAIGDGDAGHHPMPAPAERREHGQGVGAIPGLAEQAVIEHHAGVGAQHAAT